MEKSVETAGQLPVISTVGLDVDYLEQWYKEYMAQDGNSVDPESSVILSVDSDKIDAGYIERQIQQAMSVTYVSQGFCNNCQYLFSHWPDLGIKSWSHAVGRPCRTEELEAATRKGCKSCSYMLLRLRAAGLLDTFRRIEKRLSLFNDTATASISITNWGGNGLTQLLWLNFPGKVAKNCNSACARPTIFESHVVSPSEKCSDDPIDPFDIADKWLRTCSDSHESCCGKSQLRRPTRLVSIGDDVVKLVLTTDWETLPRYATLSYCWGRDDFLKLTSDKLDSFLNAIPYEDLPKTFKDAIYIARRLGLNYLWIDALCIVQAKNDSMDWLRESGHMRSVYGGGYVNIAASSATNVHEGCFSKPPDHNGGFLARVTTSEFGRVQNFHSMQVYQESTTRTHLASRAWTLQEKLLSPRTIYFGDQGLFWECRVTTGSEFLPNGFPDKLGSQLVRPEGKAWNWYDIVSDYSRAYLTHGADKLPALSGVARRQHEATGDEYLAGMWREGLIKQLGWMTLRRKKRPEWRAPTWSWTSIDTPTIYWPYWDHNDVAKNEYVRVQGVRITLAGSDPFGAVSDGELQLRCTAMVRGQYCEPDNADDVVPDGFGNDRVMLEAGTRDFPVTMDCLDDDFIRANNSIYLLPLFGGRSGRATHTNKKGSAEEGSVVKIEELVIRGIILQHSGFSNGRFRRIGSFDFRDGTFRAKSKRDCYGEFLRAMEEVGASTAESECSEIISDAEPSASRYVITIV